MSTELSAENERFIEDAIRAGSFHSRTEVLDAAVEILRRRRELLRHIDEGTQQLRSGMGIELRGDAELRAFFDELEAEGMQRYAAGKSSP